MKVKLKDKTEIEVDLNRVTVLELRKILEKGTTEDEADTYLAKAAGMTKKDLQAMGFPDYRKITKAFWELVRNPLIDEDDAKNSQSESTSA